MGGKGRTAGARLFGYFDRAYVINLDSRPDRLRRIARHLGELGIPFERFPGVVVDRADGHETAGFRGCALAHMGVWENALRAGHRRVLIFEDDAALRDDVQEQITAVIPELDAVPWDMLYLGVSLFEHSRHSRRVSEHLREFDRGADLHAYAMNAASLQRALDIARAMMNGPRKALIDLLLTWAQPPLRKLHTMPLLAVMLPDWSDNLSQPMNRLHEYFSKFPRTDFVRHCRELRRALAEGGLDPRTAFRPPPGYVTLARPARAHTSR